MISEIDWAIVIPTLNEEYYVGKLLASLVRQTVFPREIVVVDALSEDQTAAIVRRYQNLLPQIQLVSTPKSTIAAQRNIGACFTDSPRILFLDADVTACNPQTLETYAREVENKKPDIAVAENLPLSGSLLDKAYYKMNFWWFPKLVQNIYPLAMGMNYYVSREAFEEVGKFNEHVRIGEDHDLLRRMKSAGKKFCFLDEPKFANSVRRIRREGRMRYLLKMLYANYFVMRHGFTGIPQHIHYDFGHFDDFSQKE